MDPDVSVAAANVDLVIFDCDGVLVDSEVIYVDAELEFIARAGVRFERAEYMRTYMGLSLDEWRGRLSEHIEATTGRPPADDFFAGLDAYLIRAFEARLTPLPGVRASVAALPMPRCVASSTSLERLRWKLARTGLLDLFDPHLFSAEMVAAGKPAPDLFLHAAEVMGAESDRCVVVEDSVNGVRAGKAAGMGVIGLTAGGHCLDGHGDLLTTAGADLVIDTVADLPGAVARIAA